MALTESSATERWPGMWSALDRIIGTDLAAKSSSESTRDWVSPSVTGTAKVLTKQFGIGISEARRYAPAVAGLAAWRATGRHAIVLLADDVGSFSTVEDLTDSGKPAVVAPAPFMLMISEPGHGTPMTLYFTSLEPAGARFWGLNLESTRDDLDCFRPQWINLEGEGSGRGLDDEPGPDSANELVARFGFNISLRVALEPERVVEVGELLGRRTTPVPWPTAPDDGCLTLWMGRNANA